LGQFWLRFLREFSRAIFLSSIEVFQQVFRAFISKSKGVF